MTDSAQDAARQGIDPWEAAYLRFETPEEEIRKFTKRLRRLRVSEWPRETNAVELFCGRGNGFPVLARLGSRRIERVVLVEPWLTPFLRVVHGVAQHTLARRMSVKLEALATMIENERQTYENWLGRPEDISQMARRYFQPEHESFNWGKWNFVGRVRPSLTP